MIEQVKILLFSLISPELPEYLSNLTWSNLTFWTNWP